MDPNIKVSLKTALKMDKVPMFGRTKLPTLEIGWTMRGTDQECRSGPTTAPTKACGSGE